MLSCEDRKLMVQVAAYGAVKEGLVLKEICSKSVQPERIEMPRLSDVMKNRQEGRGLIEDQGMSCGVDYTAHDINGH